MGKTFSGGRGHINQMEGASAGSRRKRGRPRKIIEGRFTDLTFVPESLSDAPTTRSNVRIWSGTRVPKIPRTSSKSPERTDTSLDQSVSQSPYNTRRGRQCPCKSGIGLAIIKKDKGVVAARTEANMAPESKDTDKVEENVDEKVEENEKEKDPAENPTERSAGENVEDAAKAEILGELENYVGKTGPSLDDLTEGEYNEMYDLFLQNDLFDAIQQLAELQHFKTPQGDGNSILLA